MGVQCRKKLEKTTLGVGVELLHRLEAGVFLRIPVLRQRSWKEKWRAGSDGVIVSWNCLKQNTQENYVSPHFAFVSVRLQYSCFPGSRISKQRSSWNYYSRYIQTFFASFSLTKFHKVLFVYFYYEI